MLPEKGFFALLFTGRIEQLGDGAVFEDAPDSTIPFRAHYDQYVLPQVQEFEQKRIEALRKLRGRWQLAIPGQMLLVLMGLVLFQKVPTFQLSPGSMIFGGFTLLGLITYWANTPMREYKLSVKNRIFPNVFNFFGADYHYSPTSPLQLSAFAPSQLLPNYHKEMREDYIRGEHKTVKIELMEAELKAESGTGKNKHYRTVFRGMLILLSAHKNFKGQTIIRSDQGRFGNWMGLLGNKLQSVKLEDPVFEKMFEVSSTDQVEARYLLTTSFMERLLHLSEQFGGGAKVQGSFYDNKLMLMIPSKVNRFEVGSIYQPATFVEDIRAILSQMQEIFGIIAILKLDEKTGL